MCNPQVAIAIDAQARVIAGARTGLPAPTRREGGVVGQDPEVWWNAVRIVLRELAAGLKAHRPVGLAVDGTSSTLLLCSPDGGPLAPALMYNDTRAADMAA